MSYLLDVFLYNQLSERQKKPFRTRFLDISNPNDVIVFNRNELRGSQYCWYAYKNRQKYHQFKIYHKENSIKWLEWTVFVRRRHVKSS